MPQSENGLYGQNENMYKNSLGLDKKYLQKGKPIPGHKSVLKVVFTDGYISFNVGYYTDNAGGELKSCGLEKNRWYSISAVNRTLSSVDSICP